MQDYYRLGYQCPYIVKTDKTRITCEGGCHICFHDGGACKKYLHKYCNDTKGWQRCTIAMSLNEWWDKNLK